ncbi:MAG: MFS transporter, partial [Actinomycetota bacterium]
EPDTLAPVDERTSMPREQALFARFVGAHVAGVAGDTLVAIALSGTLFFKVSVSQARSKIGLYLLLTMAPFSLLSPVIGPMLDRHPGARRLAVVLSTAGRAAVCVVMASTFRTLLLYPLAFAILALGRTAGVARASLVPSLVSDTSRLVNANARLQKSAVVAGALIGGPGILVLKLGSESAVLLFAAGVYGVGTLAGLALPRPPREAPSPGLEPVLHLGRIRLAAEVQALIRALAGYLLFLLAFSLRRAGISGAGFGFMLAFAGLGGFAGAVAVPRLRRSGNEEWIIATALFLGGGAALIAGRSFGLDLAMVLAGAVGVVGSATRLAFDSIVQREAPEAARGRVFSRFETLFQIAWVIGAAIPVAFNVPIGPGLVAATVAYAATAVFFLGGIGATGRARIVGRPDDPTV